MKKQEYEWKKTAKKAGRVLAEIILVGTLAYITEIPQLLLLVPVVEAAIDYIKHK